MFKEIRSNPIEKSYWYAVPAILYTILIFGLSSLEQSEIPRVGIRFFDKFVHFLEYGIYAYLLMLATRFSRFLRPIRYAVVFSLVWGLFYAGTDEVHQLFVPGRDCSFFDFVADAVGIVLGIWIFYVLRDKAFIRKKPFSSAKDQTVANDEETS